MNIAPPDFVNALGWTLAHFLWQGAALGLAFYLFLVCCRSALARYWAGILVLAVMVAAPVVTFIKMRHSAQGGTAVSAHVFGTANFIERAGTLPHSAVTSLPAINWPAVFAALWFIGVLALALRALGGWVLVQRLYHGERQCLSPLLTARCTALCNRLGISRAVKFYLSDAIDAPAVIGWFRPVVLLPLTALTGLSPEQLEAIIAHELAHVQRFDCFVNLFQIAAETLLFYHPAVWWVSRTIRAERENCCDDIAVSACGDAGAYARAPTVVEGWRSMPALVMAANGSPLKLRIERLLGLKAMSSNVSTVGVAAVGLICASGILHAGAALRQPATPNPSEPVEAIPAPAPKPHPGVPAKPRLQAFAKPAAQAAPKPTPNQNANSPSYIEGLQDAGLKNLSVDDLIALKVQGVTPQYIRDIHAAGLTPSAGELIAMKVQGVTPEYIRTVRNAWPDTKIDEIIAMKVQGVNPSDAAAYRAVGLDNLNVGRLIAFRVQGITPDYVKSLKAAGFTDVTADNVIAAKVQGITPEFIQKARSHGFTNLSLSQLIRLKISDVF